MVGGRERVTNTEGASTARGLKRDKAVEIARLTGCKDFVGKRKKTGTIVWQPGSGRRRSSRSSGGRPCAQSGGQAKKAPISSMLTILVALEHSATFECIDQKIMISRLQHTLTE